MKQYVALVRVSSREQEREGFSLAAIKLQADVLDRTRDENAALAPEVFELSQTLRQKWLTADYAEKRKILEIVWLNCSLVDATLVPVIRKPFDVLVEGLVSKESGSNGN
jgi:site-specific DNA recombinase